MSCWIALNGIKGDANPKQLLIPVFSLFFLFFFFLLFCRLKANHVTLLINTLRNTASNLLLKYHCLFEKTTQKSVPSGGAAVRRASARFFFYSVMASGVESHSGKITIGCGAEVPRLDRVSTPAVAMLRTITKVTRHHDSIEEQKIITDRNLKSS